MLNGIQEKDKWEELLISKKEDAKIAQEIEYKKKLKEQDDYKKAIIDRKKKLAQVIIDNNITIDSTEFSFEEVLKYAKTGDYNKCVEEDLTRFLEKFKNR